MVPISYTEVLSALSEILRDRPELVFVSSSIGSFGEVETPVEMFLSAWIDSLPPASTLIMPTFTFSFCQNRIFDPDQTPSETGILSEVFRLRKGVLRSRHPVYSVAAFGPRAAEISNICGDTCWGPETIFELLENANALTVGFGISLARSATILHRAEELLRVPYRFCKVFAGKCATGRGLEPCQTKFWVRRADFVVKNDFTPVLQALQSEGRYRRITLGNSAIECAYSQDICRVARDLIQTDPLAVVADRERVRAEMEKVSVSFLGTSNLDLLAQALEEEYPRWDSTGIRAVPVPFGQYRPHLLKEESNLRVANPEVVVFLERMEDLCGETVIDPYGEGIKVFKQNLEDYLVTIQKARSVLKGFFIVLGFYPSLRSALGSADRRFPEGLVAMAEYGNCRLAEGLKESGDLTIIDLASILSEAGVERRSRKYWYLGRLPFGQKALNTLARCLTGVILARRGKTARLLVLDLDNTLWGGVIGEDGLEGIHLGGDYPGNAYRDFQRTLKLLKMRGVVLAIASKNTESVALEAIDQHPQMVLKRKDFATWRINWKDKASNIRSICEEIGIGTGSICFLDDNPNEREWVKSQLPEAFVPKIPGDPAERPHFLLDLPCLDLFDITEEDRHRANQYRIQNDMQTQRQTYETIEDFCRSLDMVVTLGYFGKGNKARVLQLISKTNQFNTTARRYTEADLETLIRQGYEVYAVRLKDRFRREEIIGVLIVDWQARSCRIDSFMLSCRVLGYGVEVAVLGWLRQEASHRKVDSLVGEIVETSRNQVVHSLFQDNGFERLDKGTFLLQTISPIPEVPTWMDLRTDWSSLEERAQRDERKSL